MIKSLDHVNIRVRNLEATLRFYSDVLGMQSGAPPGMSADGPEAWIRDGQGRPVLHVGTADLGAATGVVNAGSTGGSGAVHHVAFDCGDYSAALERIRSAGVNIRYNDIPAARLRQVFVVDPDGILIELNFRG